MNATKLTPAAFALALLSFLLPFTELSCQGQTLVSFTGVQLVSGTSLRVPGSNEERAVERDPRLLAVVALLAIGLFLAFKGHPSSSKAITVIGAASAVLLLLFKSNTDSSIFAEGQGMIQIHYGLGFWGAVLSSVGGAVAGFMGRTSSQGLGTSPVSQAPSSSADQV